MYVTHRFRAVKHPAVKSLPCPICGKKLRRRRTFEQTINPFNKNANGTVKTELDIVQELEAQAAAWETEAEPHSKCEAGGPDAR